MRFANFQILSFKRLELKHQHIERLELSEIQRVNLSDWKPKTGIQGLEIQKLKDQNQEAPCRARLEAAHFHRLICPGARHWLTVKAAVIEIWPQVAVSIKFLVEQRANSLKIINKKGRF